MKSTGKEEKLTVYRQTDRQTESLVEELIS